MNWSQRIAVIVLVVIIAIQQVQIWDLFGRCSMLEVGGNRDLAKLDSKVDSLESMVFSVLDKVSSR